MKLNSAKAGRGMQMYKEDDRTVLYPSDDGLDALICR